MRDGSFTVSVAYLHIIYMFYVDLFVIYSKFFFLYVPIRIGACLAYVSRLYELELLGRDLDA